MKLVEKRNKNFKQIFFGAGAFVAIFSFTAFAANLFSPIILTHADGSSITSEVIVGVDAYLSISDVSRNIYGNFGHGNGSDSFMTGKGEGSFSVYTNVRSGYEVYYSSADDETALVNSEYSDYYLNSIQAKKGIGEFSENTWGYNAAAVIGGSYADNSNIKFYYPIPTKTTPKRLFNVDSLGSATRDTYKVYFAAKIDDNMPEGNYVKSMMYTVVPHISAELQTIFDISTLQEMTAGICYNTTEPFATATEFTDSFTNDRNYIPRKKLVDTRDNKEYYVTRHAGGRCWMSEDLDLELSTSVTLTSNDTNLQRGTSWTPKNNTTSTMTVWGAPEGDAENTDHSIRVTTNGKSAVLYNISAVTAGQLGKYNYPYSEDTGTWSNGISEPDRQDICPKGWEMLNASDANSELYSSSGTYYGTTYGSYFGDLFNYTKFGYIQNDVATDPVVLSYNGTRTYHWTKDATYSCSYSWSEGNFCRTSRYYVNSSVSSNSYTYDYGSNVYRNQGQGLRCVAKGAGSGSSSYYDLAE